MCRISQPMGQLATDRAVQPTHIHIHVHIRIPGGQPHRGHQRWVVQVHARQLRLHPRQDARVGDHLYLYVCVSLSQNEISRSNLTKPTNAPRKSSRRWPWPSCPRPRRRCRRLCGAGTPRSAGRRCPSRRPRRCRRPAGPVAPLPWGSEQRPCRTRTYVYAYMYVTVSQRRFGGIRPCNPLSLPTHLAARRAATMSSSAVRSSAYARLAFLSIKYIHVLDRSKGQPFSISGGLTLPTPLHTPLTRTKRRGLARIAPRRGWGSAWPGPAR